VHGDGGGGERRRKGRDERPADIYFIWAVERFLRGRNINYFVF